MKILVTGLSGFIGQYLNQRLAGRHEIYDLGCDLLEAWKVDYRLQEVKPDIIVHLAARTEVEKSFYEQDTFAQVNYVGTVNMIEAAKKLPNLKLFLFSSTMETYGWQPESDEIAEGLTFKLPVFDENTPQHPNAPYAVAKVGGEKYLEYAGRAFGLRYCILRQTNAYGRFDNDFFVVEQIISQMLKNPDEINLGYAKPYRNFIFISDLLDLYETIIDNPDRAAGEVFCTGPANAIGIYNLAWLIASKIGWEGKIHWNTKPHRPGEIFVLNSTNAKATRLLGWEPKVSLDEGLDRTIAIWKDKLSR